MLTLPRLLPLMLSCTAAFAQCDPETLSTGTFRGANNVVSDMQLWDPDGAGPAPEVVVMGGYFTVAGSEVVDHIVAYDPIADSWQAIGSGLPPVRKIEVMPNGDLVVLLHPAFFTSDDPRGRVMRWDGAAWTQLGVDFDDWVFDLVALAGGELLVGGSFTSVGGVAMEYLSRWDGSAWQPFANGANGLDGAVNSLAVRPNGNVIIGGRFVNIGALTAPRIAEWDGSNWSTFGTGMNGGSGVSSLLVHPSGDVYAGGSFAIAGGTIADGIARWDGTSWSSMLRANSLTDLRLTPSGNVLAFASNFVNAPGVVVEGPAEWNGSLWVSASPIFTGPDQDPRTGVFLPNGDALYGGGFSYIGFGSNITYNVARKAAGGWSALGDGASGVVRCWLRLANGDLVVAGDFQAIGGIAANRIARWDGSQWHPYGGGIGRSLPSTSSDTESVRGIVETDSGDLVAAGDWVLIDGSLARQLVRWNGTIWVPVGSFLGLGGDVHALEKLPGGDLIIAGELSAGLLGATAIVRWDGLGFYDLGAGLDGVVYDLEVLPGGELLAVGEFTQAGTNIQNVALWDGASWQAMGDGLNGPVHAVTVGADGRFVVGGAFTYSGSTYTLNAAQWDGSSWQPMTNVGVSHRVDALATLPNGDVVAGGRFTSANQVAASYLARWDGSQWSPVWQDASGFVEELRMFEGDLMIGGPFESVDGQAAAYWARYETPCQASVTSYGAGCAGAAGLATLAPVTEPWLGARFESLASGLSPISIVIAAYGINTTQVPLGTILPQGLPGCDLLAMPDLLQPFLPTAGTTILSLDLPNTPALAGLTLAHQAITLELDAIGDIVAVTSSNGLSLVLGSF